MKRLHIVGGKNHGKTTLIVELVQELVSRQIPVGTIKHTHHDHELDVPGKDSYRHRAAGACVVGIFSPSLDAIYFPRDARLSENEDRYERLAPTFCDCKLILVEGDLQTAAPKIEVWRSELGTPPLAKQQNSILALVTDGEPLALSCPVLARSRVAEIANWVLERMLGATD